MKSMRGFTLLEVLVALVLVGLLMMVLFGGFRVGIHSWQATERHTAAVEEPRQLSSLLYRHLGQLQAVDFVADGQGRVEASFVGEATRMRYVAPLSISSGGAPYVFELVSDWQGKPGIWARFAAYVPGASAEQLLDGATFQLISPELTARFAYFGAANERTAKAWNEVYSNATEPPQLVSLRLRGGGQPWPELVFPVTTVGDNASRGGGLR